MAEYDIWIVPQLWATSMMRVLDPKARREEMDWLRKSLEADLLPGWCIEMVMENW